MNLKSVVLRSLAVALLLVASSMYANAFFPDAVHFEIDSQLANKFLCAPDDSEFFFHTWLSKNMEEARLQTHAAHSSYF